jgi:BioD-like phosphotransacetylase family protein
VNPGWRKSSYSNNGGGNCVEARQASGAVLIRDTTQHGHGPVLGVSAETWRTFTAAVRANTAIS